MSTVGWVMAKRLTGLALCHRVMHCTAGAVSNKTSAGVTLHSTVKLPVDMD